MMTDTKTIAEDLKILVVIDADAFTHIISHNLAKKKAKHLGKMAINRYILEVMKKANADDYVGFYDGKSVGSVPNFRNTIYPLYKANRPPSEECVKRWRPILFEVMDKKWGFTDVQGMEADDACAIAVEQFRDQYDEIWLATTDKDLKQIHNIKHYDYKKHLTTETGTLAADINFTKQMLTGDTSDNIPGLYGCGPVKATKIVEGCSTANQLFRAVARVYAGHRDEFLVKEIARQVKKQKKDYALKYPDLSAQKLTRKIRLGVVAESEILADAFMPDGWKKYMKLQYDLLRMVVTAPVEANFTMPDVQACPFVKRKSTDKKFDAGFLYDED